MHLTGKTCGGYRKGYLALEGSTPAGNPQTLSVTISKHQRIEGSIMANPVVHFEIIGKNAPQLRSYYKDLFDWNADTNSAVATEVSASGNYGFINKISTEDGTGIPGGIGGGEGYDSHTIFYVGVENVEAALLKAEILGGKRVMGPIEKPGGGLIVGHFRDPEGNLIGLAGPQ